MSSDFGKEVRELWADAEEADKDNREEAERDLKFAAGEHWDEQVREYRERMGVERYGFPLPCLTVNNMPALIGQVTGDRRANEVAVKVLPNEDGDREGADVRSEMIRSIEIRSKAQRVFMASFTSMVCCGISNFRVDLDYAYDDVFERDIFIRPIPNPLAVLWDPLAVDPTGRDASHCFVVDRISKDEFKRRFKDRKPGSLDATGLKVGGWVEGDSVRVVEYWKMIEKPRTLAMLTSQNGQPTVQDVTDIPEAKWRDRLATSPGGKPMVRKAPRKYAQMVFTNGQDELSDPFELPLCRPPIIRVSGQTMWKDDKLVRFGLVRFARDPARLKDYMRSVIAEKLMLAPRANYMGPASAFKGREEDWVNALTYNDEATVPPSPITGNDLAAMVNEAHWYAEDIKDVTGIFDASRGQRSNETSGVAIARRQQEGDIATIGYHDNMDSAQQEAGEIISDLLPVAYDTARTVRLIGANEAVKFLRVNDPADPDAIDLSKGRYDFTITTGPAYMTRRIESSAQLMELAGRSPDLIKIAGDKIIETLDIHNGDEIAARVKRSIPPQVLGDEADEGKDPQELQQQQMRAQEAEQVQKAAAQLEMESKQADTAGKVAQARKADAEARLAEANAEAAERGIKYQIDDFNAETNRLKAVTAKGFPLPPEAAAVLAPIVTQAVMQALASPDVLPDDLKREMAESAFEAALPPEQPQEGIEA